ncbi:hypothetical protein Droror1_Dr00009912 [Drosera rotundifolia]
MWLIMNTSLKFISQEVVSVIHLFPLFRRRFPFSGGYPTISDHRNQAKMAASGDKSPEPAAAAASPSSRHWMDRIFYPTILAGIIGSGVGLVSKHGKVHGLGNISATYATNFAIVTGCYCGAREFVRVSRRSDPDDLLNSAIAGLGSGALLGRLQAGQVGAIRYSIIFSVVGTTVDYATIKLLPMLQSYRESVSNKEIKLPDWSPIQVLDEEALAKKRAREQQLLAQRNIAITENKSQ